MKFFDKLYQQKTAITMLLVFILGVGSSLYFKIPKEEYPELKIPLVYVSVFARGISPEDAENMIVKPIERRVRAIADVKKVTGNATSGYGSVVVEFTSRANISKALDEVRNKVSEAKADMPKDILEPVIKEIDFSKFPVLTIGLTGDVPTERLLESARFFKKKIEEIPNILEANIVGNRKEIFRCTVDQNKWLSYKFTPSEIERQITMNNQLIPAGDLKTSTNSFSLKIPGLVKTASEIASIPVRNANGTLISFGDIASIRRDYEAANQLSRINFKPAITIEVSKRSGTNLISTIEKIRTLVDKEASANYKDIELIYSRDSSNRVKDRLEDLVNNIIVATIMVVAIVVSEIGRRQGLIVGLSVPISFFLGLMTIYHLGYTLNIVVLFGFIMSVGMIVDASIIVTEYADKKIKEGILLPSQAYIEAAKRMSVPVLSATVGLIVVYMPLLFWPGTVGGFMKFIPIALMSVLTASIISAMIFIPVIGGMWCDTIYKKDKRLLLENNSSLGIEKVATLYVKVLERIIIKPKKTIMISIFFLIGSIFAYKFLGHGVEFFTKVEPDYITASIKTKENMSLERKLAVAMEAEKIIKQLDGELDVVYSKIGSQGGGGNMMSGNSSPDTIASIEMQLAPWQHRRKADSIMEDLRAILRSVDGVNIEVSEEKKGPSAMKAIEAQILSNDRTKIDIVADKIKSFMEDDSEFINITDSRILDKIEWNLIVDRDLANKFGLDIGSISGSIRMFTVGAKIGSVAPSDSDEMLDIMLFFPKHRSGMQSVRDVLIPSQNGNLVAANEVIKISPNIDTSIINRLNGFNVITISADTKNRSAAYTKIQSLQKWFEGQNFDKSISLAFGGDKENQDETSSFLGNAFGLAILIKMAILIVQFNSLYYTLVVMSAVVLAVAGVFIALILTGKTFSIVMCGLGIVSLAGIVVSNNIIFIDTYQRLIENGMEIKEAILTTARERFRPIIMTSATTIIGLIPMVFNFGINFLQCTIDINSPSGQWWEQLSTTIAGGLICTTFLTLFLTPSILAIHSPITKKH